MLPGEHTVSDFTEKLILEVGVRPGLYNMAPPEYSDRNLKLKLWEEVCQQVIPTWNDLDFKENAEKGRNCVQYLIGLAITLQVI